jgi:hypothetical protein
MPGKFIHVGDILTCNCLTPLAKRVEESTWQIFRYFKGQKILVEIEQSNAGINKICCPTCGYKYTKISLNDTIYIR